MPPEIDLKAPEQAASDIKNSDAKANLSIQVQQAMQTRGIDTRVENQKLSAAMEANGTLPALILDGFHPKTPGGVVTRAELTAQANSTDQASVATLTAVATLSKFNEIDKDGDDKITAEEMAAWQQTQKGRPEQVRYPDGSTLQVQPDSTYKLLKRDGTLIRAVPKEDVQPDGSVVLARDGAQQPTSVLKNDGSTLTLAKQGDGKYHPIVVRAANGAKLTISYDAGANATEITDRTNESNPRIIAAGSSDKIQVDEQTGAVVINRKNKTREERDANGVSRNYDATNQLTQMKNANGDTTHYYYTDGKLTNVIRDGGTAITAADNGALSVDHDGNVTAVGADGKQTLFKVDRTEVKSEPDGHDGMRVTDVTYPNGESQRFNYSADGTMIGYKDVNGKQYTSTNGKDWTAGAESRHFQITVDADGTTTAVLPGALPGGIIDRALTDGRGSQQDLSVVDRAPGSSTESPTNNPGDPQAGRQPGAGDTTTEDSLGVHVHKANGDHIITQTTPEGSVVYTYPKDKSQPITISWRDPSNVVRETLTGVEGGPWTRSGPGIDGQETVTDVQQTDKGYTCKDSKGQTIDQAKDGTRMVSKDGNFIHYDANGNPDQIHRVANGLFETFNLDHASGKWKRISGRTDGPSAGASSEESVSNVTVDANGNYRFLSRDNTRETVQMNDGRRVDNDYSKAGKTSYLWGPDGTLKAVQHTDNGNNVVTMQATPGGWEVQVGADPPFRAKVDIDALNGAYHYVAEDGSREGHQSADGSNVFSIKQVDGSMRPVAIGRPDGVRYAVTYGTDGTMKGIELHIPAKQLDQDNSTPERIDTWLPTENPGEMRRSDGVVATNLTYDNNGNFSFVYINEKGVKVKHTDRADGSQENIPV
ncbi:MAG: hypothetical protein JST89_26290 [Cyanobacteria bacterium SZAS-4]|nr:hypothetical protein [Cyanobacteria bacterium SZAS-4]